MWTLQSMGGWRKWPWPVFKEVCPENKDSRCKRNVSQFLRQCTLSHYQLPGSVAFTTVGETRWIFMRCLRGEVNIAAWRQEVFLFLISGFRRDVKEICALVAYYAANSCTSLPTFRDNISVPETSVGHYSSTLPKIAEDRRYPAFFLPDKIQAEEKCCFRSNRVFCIQEGRTNIGRLVCLATNCVMYGDSNILSICFLKICCTDSMYNVYKDKLHHCSCKHFE